MTLLAATALAGCAYAPYHNGGAVRDYDYGYNDSGFNDRDYDDFYYYPSLGIYFNISSGYYYYQDEHRWVRTRTLPRHYRLHPDHRVRMKAHRDQPYRDYQKHSQTYRRDGDRWRQHDGRNDGRGDRDGDRRRDDRNDRSDRHDRHSSIETQSGPRRFERNRQDDGRRHDQAVERPLRNRERTEGSAETRRKAESNRRIKEAHTFEKRQTLKQDALNRQQRKREQDNRQADGRTHRDSGRAERRDERHQTLRDEARPDRDRARRTDGRADRQEAGPVERRREGEAGSDEDLRWLRHNDRNN
ncbi:hypothetical protein [Marinobacterium sedimentorum]|uniref:hypothetical protein n=1 Tax=Marinobacterium sedimentorum TaxID=2927804 RepID=UPI0020C6F9DA|nr:hypothetical protein [Marinobacterium sedimentorum]MCP8687091.1 hypothetical protein [Marinobacterium sedimentorum]